MTKEKEKVIEVSKEGKVGVIRFHAPPLNIITREFKDQLEEAVKWVEAARELRVLIICNQGKYFGAGGDVNEMMESDYQVDKLEKIIQRVTDLPMPTIAAMDGGAYGGSFEIALACNMRIARSGSILSFTEVNFGSFPGVGGTSRLIQLMGQAKAIEVMLMAYQWPAERWLEYGVLNAVADIESAYEMAMRWAKQIESKPFSGPRAVKDAASSYMRPRYEEFRGEQQRIMEEVEGKSDIVNSSKEFLKKR